MHEASVVQGLLKLCLEALDKYRQLNPAEPAPKISRIICEAGLLACFEQETLKACFEMFAENTPVDGAELIIKYADLPCVCRQCGNRFSLDKKEFFCPACKSRELDFKGGNGLTLLAINAENRKD